MDINSFFSGALLLSGITYIGYQLKTIPNLLFNEIKKRIIYSVYVEETSDLFFYFEEWLRTFHEECFRTIKADLFYENSSFPEEKEELIEEDCCGNSNKNKKNKRNK